MEQVLKERLAGVAILFIIAVIFIPAILNNPVQERAAIGADLNQATTPPDFTSRYSPVIHRQQETLPVTLETDNIAAMPGDTSSAVVPDIHNNIQHPIEQREVVTNEQPLVQEKVTIDQGTVAVADGTAAPQTTPFWFIQLGSFNNEQNAERLQEKLRQAGYVGLIHRANEGEKIVYRVRVETVSRDSDAKLLLQSIKEKLNIDGIVIQ